MGVDRFADGLQFAGDRWIGNGVALHQTHRAKREAHVKPHPARVADDELGAAATDVEDERRIVGQARARHSTGEGQARLVVAAEHVHRLAKRIKQFA